MKLPQEIMNKLFICAKKKIKIKVEGKNSLGQKFQTEGFILPKTNKDKPVFINENGIALYVGQVEKKENGKELPPYFAGFYTEYFDVNDIIGSCRQAPQRGIWQQLMVIQTVMPWFHQGVCVNKPALRVYEQGNIT